jgi:hypothetical protein
MTTINHLKCFTCKFISCTVKWSSDTFGSEAQIKYTMVSPVIARIHQHFKEFITHLRWFSM